MKWIVIRVTLFVVYVAALCFVCLLFGGAGHGSFAPGAIFFSWAYVPGQLAGGEGWCGHPLFFGCYILLLFEWISRAGKSDGCGALAWPLVVHFAGVPVALAVTENGSLNTKEHLVMSVSVAATLALVYYALDARLAWIVGRSSHQLDDRDGQV